MMGVNFQDIMTLPFTLFVDKLNGNDRSIYNTHLTCVSLSTTLNILNYFSLLEALGSYA